MGMDSYDLLANEILGLFDSEGPYAAIDRLNRGRDAGDSNCTTILGELYAEGVGVVADPEMAKEYLEEAVVAGNGHAMTSLGGYYLYGQGGFPKDEARSNVYLKKASDLGIPRAMGLYAGNLFWGVGIAPDPPRAVELAARAAKLGDYDGNLICATAYRAGLGVNQNIPLAILHYREMLRQQPDDGDTMAWLALCLCDPFESQGTYVPSREECREGFDLACRGVELGSVRAHLALGAMYASGRGAERDYDLAHRYIEIAAQNGDEDAQRILKLFRRTIRGTWTL